MSYELTGDGTDFSWLRQRIDQLEQEVGSLPYQFPAVNDGVIVPALNPSFGGGGGGSSGIDGVETNYSDEGDTSGAVTITIDGNKKYVRKYTLTGDITSITITSTNLTTLFPTDLILIFEQTLGNVYTLPTVTALHPDDILSKSVIADGETEEFEFVTYNAGSEWILKSQHDNAFLAYLDGISTTAWANIGNFAEGARDAILGLGLLVEDGITYMLKQINDVWIATPGDTWEEKLVNLISTEITSVLTNFGEQVLAWWNGLAADTSRNAVDEFFYQVQLIGEPVFRWMSDWESDTRAPDGTDTDAGEVDYSDPPTFSQLTTDQNAPYLRVIRSVTTWWDDLPTTISASISAFDLPFVYVKKLFNIADDLGAWLFDNVADPLKTWWEAISLPTNVDDNFQNRLWYGVIGVGHGIVDSILDIMLGDGEDSNTVAEHIERVLDKLFETAATISTRMLNAIFGEDLAADIITGIKDIGTFWNGVVGTVRTTAEALIKDPVGWLGTQASALADAVLSQGNDFIDKILDVVLDDNMDSANAGQHITRIWNKITGLGTTFTDGFSDAIDTAVDALDLVSDDVRDWLNTNVTTPVRAGLLTLGTWLGTGADVITKVIADIPGHLYNGATTFTHVVQRVLFGGINTTVAGWLGDQGAAILVALGGAGDTAWDWLQALGLNARNFVKDISSAVKSTLDVVVGWVGTATNALSWLTGVLFTGFNTPSAFADSAADGQIASALLSGGDITAKIGTDIIAAWDAFWVDLGNTAHGTSATLAAILDDIAGFFTGGTADSDDDKADTDLNNLSSVSINTALRFADVATTTTLNARSLGMSDTGKMEIKIAASGDFHIKEGSNILFTVQNPTTGGSVQVNKKLLFPKNTNTTPGDNDLGIGGNSTSDMFFKAPNTGSRFYWESNGAEKMRITSTGVFIADGVSITKDLSTRRLRVTGGTISASGDIGKVGDDVIIRTGEDEDDLNLTDLLSGGGGGGSATLPSSNRIPIIRGSNGSAASVSALDTAFGTDQGSIGMVIPFGTVNTSTSLGNIYVRSINRWLRIPIQASPSSWSSGDSDASITTRSLFGTAYDSGIEKKKIQVISGSGGTPSVDDIPDSSLAEGRLTFYEDTSRNNRGALLTFAVGEVFQDAATTGFSTLIGSTATDDTVQYLTDLPLWFAFGVNYTYDGLDNAFGAYDGTIGVIATGASTMVLYVKVNGYWFPFNPAALTS